MSGEPELTGVVDPDAEQPAVAEQPAAEVPVVEAQPTPEDDAPEAVEITPGEKYVPLSAVKALREELKSVKALAQKANQLESELNAARPYVDFLNKNQHLLQPKPEAPPPPPDPSTDPTLVEYARTLDLYDAAGQPDVKRAAKLREMTRAEAQAVAQAALAPMATQTNEQRAAQNLSHIMATAKDANGQALEEQYLTAAVRSVTGQVPRDQAVKILADPQVANLLALTALGLQASHKKGTPAAAVPAVPAPGPVLETERPGGSAQVQMTEESRRLMRSAGISEKQWTESAKKYVPGRANVLE